MIERRLIFKFITDHYFLNKDDLDLHLIFFLNRGIFFKILGETPHTFQGGKWGSCLPNILANITEADPDGGL